jgi:integrase
MEARVGIEPTYKGFADLSLTTWVPRQLTSYCVLPSGHLHSEPTYNKLRRMDTLQLIKRNRLPRKQKGERIETKTAWCLRYYVDGTQKFITLAHKDGLYRSWADVEPLIENILREVNDGRDVITPQQTLTDFVESHYLPWCDANKAAPTANAYRRIWHHYWKSHIGGIALTNLQTAEVTAVLTALAKSGKGSRTLSHVKWMLSGVYQFAIASGIVPKNPVPDSKWLVKVARTKKQREYSLQEIQAILAILEPLDLRAATAVALCYFAALRPAEARGLQWLDYDGSELHIKRTVWRGTIGETKTEDSHGSVPVIEPLRGLLEKLRQQSAGDYILSNGNGKPLSLDSLNTRVITPAMEKAGIDWRGYYPGRRGISSLVTDTSKNALNSTGLLRHSTPITALKDYTRAQKDSIAAALKTVEEMATKPAETVQCPTLN